MSVAAAPSAFQPIATDGEIAAINLESARRRAWARFTRDPGLPGVAESLVDMERLRLQYAGDVEALDRLETLAARFATADRSFRAALVQAEVASTGHRFADARSHLACAQNLGAPRDDVDRQALAIDQACSVALDKVLDARRRLVAESGRLEDLVPLGALLADLERFAEADAVYRQAFAAFDGASPFPPAWVCFQLGMLWGELVPAPDLDLAARWYRHAIGYVPGYVRARVHLAEICARQDLPAQAEALLLPALASSDPEVPWRLADVLAAQGRHAEAALQRGAARQGFERILGSHLLAFADHGAEFYAGSGNDPARALELARANVANRPTPRAVGQMQSLSQRAGTTSTPTSTR
jgi:tetratricopeptide (TPR) repeat protein